jgi:ketosteroid isomerase-like protein
MRKYIFAIAMLLTASFLTACNPAANSNTSNTAANGANNSAAKPAANTAAIEADVKKLVTDAAASLSKNDVAAFEKSTTDNYMFVNPNGVVTTRAERAAAMKSGETKYESVAYDEVSVRVNPEGTGAVVIGRATVKGVNMGNKVDGQYRVTQVWSKTADGWKMASGQATPISAAAASPASNTAASNSNAAPAANTNKGN